MESHEARDFSVRKVVWTSFGLLCLLAVVAVAALFRQRSLVGDYNQVDVPPKTTPRQQAEFETGELQQALYREQNEKLNHVGWVDSDKTWAQVSFETAARLILAKKSTDPKVLYQNQNQRGRP
jgi:hypothetical protein